MVSSRFSAIVLAMMVLPLFARADTPANDLSKENAELKAKVDTLERQVKELNRKLLDSDNARKVAEANAEVHLQYRELLVSPPTTLPSTQTLPARPKIPPGAIEHQFNGDVYYVIPISTDLTAGSACIKATPAVRR